MDTWKYFLIMTLSCIVVQAFFSMMEMAYVSFNTVRLQYYVSKNSKRAIWIAKLLKDPTQLFGTTLVGINLTLQMGSEASRHFYKSIGFSPDLAPLTQVILVLILAELAPMFAGRKYAEHAAMLGSPVVYGCSILLRPINLFCDLLCKIVYKFLGTPANTSLLLSREELQKVLEEQEDSSSKADFSHIVKNIFTLKSKAAKDLMQPLSSILMIPSHSTLEEMQSVVKERFVAYVPVFHKNIQNIVSIVYPRDLLRLPLSAKIRDYGRVPWFITENTSILQILKQFRRNNQSIAVVLDDSGIAVGVLTLDEIVDEIFGQFDNWMAFGATIPQLQPIFIDRTFSGDMLISDLNKEFHSHLETEAETLEEFMVEHLGHVPIKGESVRAGRFLFTIEEAPLIGEKMISVRTVH